MYAIRSYYACALVFEAGRAADAIITRRKGTGAVHVEVTGVAAHAGNHHADGGPLGDPAASERKQRDGSEPEQRRLDREQGP